MATAVARLLGIVELFESILLEVPPIDVLIWRRVCVRWRDIIDGSKMLQCAMFFRPVSSSLLLHVNAESTHDIIRRDGTRAVVFRSVATWPTKLTFAGADHKPQHIYANPMLDKFFSTISNYTKARSQALDCPAIDDKTKRFLLSCFAFQDTLPDAYLRPEASWKRMLLTQPPSEIVLALRRIKTDSRAGVTVRPRCACNASMFINKINRLIAKSRDRGLRLDALKLIGKEPWKKVACGSQIAGLPIVDDGAFQDILRW